MADREPVVVTHDRILRRQLAFDQPAEGYRAAEDGLLLVAFAGSLRGPAVDLGAGAGMVTLVAARNNPGVRVVAVESDAMALECLRSNVTQNALSDFVTIVDGDVLQAARSRRGSAATVLANPPFWTQISATPPRNASVRAARHGHERDPLAHFVTAARQFLGRGGRACFVWPAADTETLFARASHAGLHPRRARFVHTDPAAVAHRVLVELKPGRAGGLSIEPPVILRNRDQSPSSDATAIADHARFATTLESATNR